MTKRYLGLFPGQGSQKVGMGKDLAARSEIARTYFEKADRALGFPLSEICYEGPAERLMATEITQPAILTVSVICYELAKEACGGSLPLAAAAGHSLGEYSALVAAEALQFEDAVLLVNKRGRYMQEAVPAGKGKMVAVLGKEIGELEAAIALVTEGVAQIANINAPGQIVVAGDVTGVEQFVAALGSAKVLPLQVSAPFHCSLMKPAEENLAKDLATLSIASAKFPVYANFSAMPVSAAEEIRAALRRQVCSRVRWVESMERAIVEIVPDAAVEFGAGNVLSGLLKRIAPSVPRENVGSIESVATFNKAA